MASNLPVANVRDASKRSKNSRIGALLDLSRGEPPLTVVRRIPQKEPPKVIPSEPTSSRSRTLASRIPQGPSSQKLPTQGDNKIPRPPLTQETQISTKNVRSGIPTTKPVTAVGTHIEPSKPPRNTLRRKPSTMLKEPVRVYAHNQTRSDAGSVGSLLPIANNQTQQGVLIGLSELKASRGTGETHETQHADSRRMKHIPQIYPELDRYRDIQVPPSRDVLGRDALYRLATEDLPPPTPLFSGASSHSQLSNFSASPSTRFSGSPGPGPYSRDTTPTSISSQSPSLIAPTRLPAIKPKQYSPAETRPPVTRRRTGSVSNEGGSFSSDPQGLAAVREALTSSSSGSTVRADDNKFNKAQRAAPNPPPRKYSQKFHKGRSEDDTHSSSQSYQHSPPPIARSSSPEKSTRSIRNRPPSLVRSPPQRSTPPSRPSRDGTPDLYYQFGGPVPIIHSNLSATSLAERRQSGQLQPNLLPKLAPRLSHESTGSSRPSLSREPTPGPRAGVLPSLPVAKNETGKTSRDPSPNVSTFKTRFPLFGRRQKSGPEVTQTEKKKEKVPRKGPAAGTGHEGYGKVGAIKRRSNTLQRGIPGLLSSSESLAATLTDQFLLDRMSPVIIAGGEVVENQNSGFDLTRTDSNQSVTWRRPSLPSSRQLPVVPASKKEDNRQTLWPSPFISEAAHARRPSDNGDLVEVSTKSRLPHQRVSRELKSRDNLTFNIPDLSHNRAPSAASTATTIHTDDDDSSPDVPTEQNRIPTPIDPAPKKLTKRAKSPRRWNFFGRSQARSTSKKPTESVPATVQPSQNTSPAFYAIIDAPKQIDRDTEPVANMIPRETEYRPSLDIPSSYDRRPSTSSVTGTVSQAHVGKDIGRVDGVGSKPSDILPQIVQPSTKAERAPTEQYNIEPPARRPSRLPQVGRIPRVIASRPEQTSPKSFSRPFNRISVQLLPTRSTQPNLDFVAKGPSPPESMASATTEVDSSRRSSEQTYPLEDKTLLSDVSILGRPGVEFLAFSPVESSETAEGSESSCSNELSYATPIARVTEPSAPYGEDEVWDEYNDLFGDSPPSPTSSCGVPFALEIRKAHSVKRHTKALESPTVNTNLTHDVRISVATAKTATTSSHYSADMTARINAAFRFNSEPLTPYSTSEFISGYGNADNDKTELDQEPERPELDQETQKSESTQEFKKSSRDSFCSQEDQKHKSDSKRNSEGSKRASGSSRLSNETPLSQVNLRVGSMTVSKWLTFGHVLFSPVREDLINDGDAHKRQSILIIDGLGNDDWSFYAAETYPTVSFFNLSPRAPLSEEQRTTSFPISPPNHHQIQFTSYADKFPFGPDSFTAVVFRFPSAAPEAHYRNIISEAQRVLKPGGFIEFSVLDVDLHNVGSRTRRAVRHLKEEVTAQNPDFNLSSTADLILRLLGKRNFIDVKTCRVAVPVASSVTKRSNKDGKTDERSLAEMMNDKTETGDENITKMVSKVGRWWYNRCYEIPTGMGSSIWHDRALLAECEEWGTSLKLMVCHARVPEARIRMASI